MFELTIAAVIAAVAGAGVAVRALRAPKLSAVGGKIPTLQQKTSLEMLARYADVLQRIVDLGEWYSFVVQTEKIPVIRTTGSLDEQTAWTYVPEIADDWEMAAFWTGGQLAFIEYFQQVSDPYSKRASGATDSYGASYKVKDTDTCKFMWYFNEEPFWCCQDDDDCEAGDEGCCEMWNKPEGLQPEKVEEHLAAGYREGSWMLEADLILREQHTIDDEVPLLEQLMDDYDARIDAPPDEIEQAMIDKWKDEEGRGVLGFINKNIRRLTGEITWARSQLPLSKQPLVSAEQLPAKLTI